MAVTFTVYVRALSPYVLSFPRITKPSLIQAIKHTLGPGWSSGLLFSTSSSFQQPPRPGLTPNPLYKSRLIFYFFLTYMHAYSK